MTLPLLACLCSSVRAEVEGLQKTPKPPPLPSQPQMSPAGVSFLVGGSDSCATPDAISGAGPFAFDNTLATTGTQGQANASCTFFGYTAILHDVWFAWTAASSGTATLQLCNGVNTVDTKVAIYSGNGCPSSPPLGCNDDNCATFQSTVVFGVTAGLTYTIQLGTYPGGGGAPGGTGTFTINVNPAPPNDDCSTPTVISGNGPFPFDTSLATTGTQGQNNSRCYIYNTKTVDYDVWYRWTAGSTGWVALDLCTGATHDSRVAVYAGSGCPTGEPIICDDDGCGTISGSSHARFFATAGATYTFQIGSYQGNPGAPGTFVISPFTPGAGDDCAAPIDISGAGSFVFDCTNGVTGTAGQSEVLCGGEMIMYDVWYRWTSFCTGNVTVSTCLGATADTKIAIYTASSCPSAAALACNDDGCGGGGTSSVTFAATSGTTYMIQIGMWPGEVPSGGVFDLTTPCPPPVGTTFCIGDGVSPHTACPCANHSATADQVGCLSSLGTGGKLRAQGDATLSNDQDGTPSVTLVGTQMPNSSVLYFQGAAQINSGNGVAFGDGLRCAGGTVVRIKTLANSGGTSSYPSTGTDPAISVKGGVTTPGTTRTYQAWYRNAAAFCTASTFNLTNGVSITWN